MINTEKNILLITNNIDRYSANTQMEKVICWLESEDNISTVNIRKLFNREKSIFDLLISEIKRIKPKIIIFIDGPPIIELSLEELKVIRKFSYIAVFFGDIFAHFNSSYKYFCQSIDCALVDESVELGRFKLYGVDAIFVPYAYDVPPLEKYQFNNFRKDIDVSFIGRQDRVGRREYISFLKDKCDISLYGVGTVNGPVSDTEMDKIFRRSKINLNFTGVQVDQPFSHAEEIDLTVRSAKGRCQEVALRGGFVMTEVAPEIDILFNLGKEVEFFDNKSELIEKIDYYLEHEDIANEIAWNGYIRAHENYRVEVVWSRTIKSLLERAHNKSYKILQKENRVISGKEYQISYARNLFAYLRTLKRKKEFRVIFRIISNIGFLTVLEKLTILIKTKFKK